MTTEVTNKNEAPNGVKLEVVVLIDQDKWGELKAQGYSDKDIQRAVEKSITLTHEVSGIIPTSPVWDIESVTTLKYY
jgi:hypothetical protein